MKKIIVTVSIIFIAVLTANNVYAARAQMFGEYDIMSNYGEWGVNDSSSYGDGLLEDLFKKVKKDTYIPYEVENSSPTDPVFSGRDSVQSIMYNSILTTDPRLAPYMGQEETQPQPRSVERSTQNMPLFQRARIKLMNKIRRNEEQAYLKDLENEKKQLAEYEKSLDEESQINNIFYRYKRTSSPKDIVKLKEEVKEIVIEEPINELSEENPLDESKIVPLKGKLREVRGENIIILDAKNIYYVEADDEIIAENSAIVKLPRQKITITADRFVYSDANNVIKAIGNVVMKRKGHSVYSDYMQVNVNEEEISVDNIVADFTNTKMEAKNAISRDDTLYLYNGYMQSSDSNNIRLQSRRIRGMKPDDLIPVEDEDKYYIQRDIFKNNGAKLFADRVIINAKDDHDVISLKKAKLYYGDKKILSIPSMTAYTDKSHSVFEASYPEFGTMSRLGAFIGPGFAFDIPHAGVMKFFPFLNYRKGDFGIGGALRYRSANNFTEVAYGSVSDIFVAKGYQYLDDHLIFRYGMNSFLGEWFLGARRPKYAAELLYSNQYMVPNSLKNGLNLAYRHMATLGYYHNSMYNMNFETFKGNNFGTMRGRYMAEISQDLYNYFNREQHFRFNLSALMQGSAALYGNGSTQFVGRLGISARSQYKYWIQNIAYFLSGSEDHTPMKRFDAYRYGTSSIRVMEAIRLCRFLSVAWSGMLTLSDDAPNKRMMQENAFLFLIGPDDCRLTLGYDYIRKRTYITLGIAIDTTNSRLDYDVMEIKNPDKFGDDSEKIEELAPDFWLIPEPKTKAPRYQKAQVISIDENDNRERTD